MNKIGLALSGGGYRATLFSLGSILRLNEAGLLKEIDRITAVSGGAILLGVLANRWNELTFNSIGQADNIDVITNEIRNFCSKSLDIGVYVRGAISPFTSIGRKVVHKYDERLFEEKLISTLPYGPGIPEFLFYATNYVTGSSVRITRNKIVDYKIGQIKLPNFLLSEAVASSSAFPPLFSPIVIKTNTKDWQKSNISSLHNDESVKDRLYLVDGGLYDNLGIEAIWKTNQNSSDKFDSVFVSDAGAPFNIGFDKGGSLTNRVIRFLGVRKNIISQLSRMSSIMIDQQRALRKLHLIKNYEDEKYKGAYWGIDTKIEDFKLDNLLMQDSKKTHSLSQVATRLKKFDSNLQDDLINWGYALCDAALRKYNNVNSNGSLPYK